MKIFTSRYANPELKEFAGVKCGISRGLPKFALKYKLDSMIYDLAPSKETFACQDERQAREMYIMQLENLGLWRVLESLKSRAKGQDIVLLCFEDLRKPGKWCHRTFLREWLKNGGVDVVELEPFEPKPLIISEQMDLFGGV